MITNQCTQYRVLTACGRNFIWSAIDRDSLGRELQDKGYRATHVEPYTEYAAEVDKQFGQEQLNHEHINSIQKGDAA